MPRRAIAPPVAVALLVLVTVGLGTAVAGLGAIAPPEPPPQAALQLAVDADRDRVALTHLGGEPLDVERVRLRLVVDGTPLSHQPPLPFFTARGFRAGPTGPFNPATDQRWTPGETASLRLASTNSPLVDPGERVRAEVYVSGHRIARLSAVAD